MTWHTARLVDEENLPHGGASPDLSWWPDWRGKEIRVRFVPIHLVRIDQFRMGGCDCDSFFEVENFRGINPGDFGVACRRMLEMAD